MIYGREVVKTWTRRKNLWTCNSLHSFFKIRVHCGVPIFIVAILCTQTCTRRRTIEVNVISFYTCWYIVLRCAPNVIIIKQDELSRSYCQNVWLIRCQIKHHQCRGRPRVIVVIIVIIIITVVYARAHIYIHKRWRYIRIIWLQFRAVCFMY